MWKDLITSKKFIASLAGVIVAIVAKIGMELETETIGILVAPLVAYIAGQGIADLGKEKAKIENVERARVADKLFEEVKERSEYVEVTEDHAPVAPPWAGVANSPPLDGD